MYDTEQQHCPTCGGDVDAHALDIMLRNRNARDAQLAAFTEELRQRDTDDQRSWSRHVFATQAVFALLIIVWLAWTSAEILRLRNGAS